VAKTRTPLGERTSVLLSVTAVGADTLHTRSGESTWTDATSWREIDGSVDSTTDPGWGASSPTGAWRR
jgi:hypothetical protein